MNINEYITHIEGVCGGCPIIKGTCMPVRAIAGCFRLGMTLDEIFDAYPYLKPQQICAALTYYFEYQDEIDADIEADSVAVHEVTTPLPPFIKGEPFGRGTVERSEHNLKRKHAAFAEKLDILLGRISEEEQLELISYIASNLKSSRRRQHPLDLEGFLVGKVDPNFDIDSALKEMREEWLKELEAL